MTHTPRRITTSFLLALLAAGIALAPGIARSQAKNVTVIVPFGPGGNFDLNARLLAKLVQPHVSEPWVVVNRAGFNGAIGIGEMMKAKPDGRTITMAGSSLLLTGLTSDVAWKGAADFENIAIVMASYSVHFVRADAPWKTMTELVEYSKKNPGAVTYGVTGPYSVGTLRHLMLRQATGIEWNEISYTGDAQTVTALLGGHIQTGAGAVAGVVPLARAGKLRILAVPAEERVPSMPDVPTFKEMGYPVVLPSLNVMLAPKGTPANAVKPLAAAIDHAVKTDEYRKFVEDSGAVAYVKYGEPMKTTMLELEASYRKVAPLLAAYIKANSAK